MITHKLCIIFFNYNQTLIEDTLDQIFIQKIISNYEIIYINGNTDHPKIKNSFIKDKIIFYKHSDTLSLANLKKICFTFSEANYFQILENRDIFDPIEIYKKLKNGESYTTNPKFYAHINDKVLLGNFHNSNEVLDTPLISITIHNYNYGRYLTDCFDSVLKQTYTNYEVLFSDNFSTDNSWDIAIKYYEKFRGKLKIIRNNKNLGSARNHNNCLVQTRGKYLLNLCSDDILIENALEESISYLKKYPEAGYLMFHCDKLSSDEKIYKEEPFYNYSCLIPGKEQALVYLMSSVNPTMSQIIYDRHKLSKIMAQPVQDSLSALDEEFPIIFLYRWFAWRIFDFKLCINHPMIYLNKALLINRTHEKQDRFTQSKFLIDIIAPYLLNIYFAEFLSETNDVEERLEKATLKLAQLSLRYAKSFNHQGDYIEAERYHKLAFCIYPKINQENDFKSFNINNNGMFNINDVENIFLNKANLRKESYLPPNGSIKI
jgi:glycosyltransferase involved in cell wall biosynthesis